MIVSVFPNLNNNGVKDLAKNVIETLSNFGASVYIPNEYK